MGGDSRRVQIFFKFVDGRISAKVIQFVKEIVMSRALFLFIEYNGLELGNKGNAPKSNLKIARRGLIPTRCEACNMMTTAHGERYVLHLPILQASSSTGNTTACIWDGALTKKLVK